MQAIGRGGGAFSRLDAFALFAHPSSKRLVPAILLGTWPSFGGLAALRGEYRLTATLGAASLPGHRAGEVELLSGQDTDVRRSQYLILEFRVAGGAGCTAATWYCAEKASSVPDDVLLEIGGSVSDVGADLIVNVPLLEAQTEALPAGRLFHQLWVTDSLNRSVPAAEGTLTVNDSLRS